MDSTDRSKLGWYGPGGVLIGALVVFAIGAAIGFAAPSLRDASPWVTEDAERVAEAIAGNPSAWIWANRLILSAMIATALGLVPISLRFDRGTRSWGIAGLVTMAIAACFGVLDRFLSIRVTTWAAPRYADATVAEVSEAFDRLGSALGGAFIFLAFLAVTLYGFAMSQTPGDDGLGWMFVGLGVLGMLAEVVGLAIPGFVFLATAALGLASWRRPTSVPAQ